MEGSRWVSTSDWVQPKMKQKDNIVLQMIAAGPTSTTFDKAHNEVEVLYLET